MSLRGTVVFVALICSGIFLWPSAGTWRHRSTRPEQSHKGIEVGFRIVDRAPDFELLSLGGSRVKLLDLRGQPVLLNFWATWCEPCRVEMPWLVEIDEKYRAQGLRIVGVSMDDSGAVQKVAAFAKEKGVKYQVLLGNSSTADAYGGVRFMPQSFFIDAEGKITKTTIGLTAKKDLEDGAQALLSSKIHHD
jgi:peroxiredoxin